MLQIPSFPNNTAAAYTGSGFHANTYNEYMQQNTNERHFIDDNFAIPQSSSIGEMTLFSNKKSIAETFKHEANLDILQKE